MLFNLEDVHPIMHAAYGGDLDTLQSMLAAELGLMHVCELEQGATLLLLAASNGQLATVQWLLQAGKSKINERDNNGVTALLWAASTGHVDIVRWLLFEGGAKVDERDYNEDTALLWAAANGHHAMVQYLITQAKANVNEYNLDGDTALSWAAFYGQLPVVHWLLVHTNAALQAINMWDRTALGEAVFAGRMETALYLYHAHKRCHAETECVPYHVAVKFDKRRQGEVVRIRTIYQHCNYLPKNLIKLIHEYAFFCLSAVEERNICQYVAQLRCIAQSRHQLVQADKSFLLHLFSAPAPIANHLIPSAQDISRLLNTASWLQFTLLYATNNGHIPLEQNPLHARVQTHVVSLEEKNVALQRITKEIGHGYVFVLKVLRALSLLGTTASIAAMIVAASLVSGVPLVFVAVAGLVVGAASIYSFFKSHQVLSAQKDWLVHAPVSEDMPEVSSRNPLY